MVWLEPSGSVRSSEIESPAFGFDPRAIEIDCPCGGELLGPVTVAPVKLEVALASLKPNGEPAASSVTDTVEPDGAGMRRRPSPVLPWSACRRCAITWVRPACVPVPLRIAEALATDGWFVALPEKM